jgi:transcriptional regulator with XRE-family HTH domain
MGNELGLAIRARRKQLGLTQAQIAESSGIERSHITRIEGGRWVPRLDTLGRLAKALRTTSMKLLSANGAKR